MATVQPRASGNRTLILGATLLATFLTAMEATVVSTAMPTIIGELRGLNLYAWVFSAYLLTSTATVPLYGRLADMVGRKPVFIAGIGIFLLGSVLSGAAQSMPQLIFFRAIQGLGAGAVQPIIFTIVGDLFSLRERARVQGFFSAVWGASSVAGPALGAIITETIGWRWIFYINLPFGIAAMALLAFSLHERKVEGKHRLDYAGAAVLTGGVATLLLGLLGGSRGGGINPPLILGGFALLVLFVIIETRVAEPILPLDLFREPAIAVPCLAGLVTGIVQFSLPSYLPLFVQGVQLGTAGDAAKPLGAIATAWTVAAFISPRMLLRVGFRAVAVGGMLLIAVGTAALLLYRPGTPIWLMVINTAIVGLGLGFASNATLIAAQNAVGWERRGVVTASVQFTRTMGGTLGIAALGALLNARLAPILQAGGAADVNALLDPAQRGNLTGDALAFIQRGLASGLNLVYLIIVVITAVGVAFVCFLPAHPMAPATAPATRAETAAD
ncbi:MAG TPA: MDR family MFS transporter [Thermomicrobiales bacterium]